MIDSPASAMDVPGTLVQVLAVSAGVAVGGLLLEGVNAFARRFRRESDGERSR